MKSNEISLLTLKKNLWVKYQRNTYKFNKDFMQIKFSTYDIYFESALDNSDSNKSACMPANLISVLENCK